MAKKRPAKKKAAPKKKTAKQTDGTCFVVMPFRDPFGLYYNAIIDPAIRKAGLDPLRGDSLFLPTPIMGDIWKMIQDAKVVLAELTSKNANVFYELGLAHAIGKPVVLISETMEDVPFDLQALRVITYDKNDPKWGDKLRAKVIKTLKAAITEPVEAVPPMFRKKVKSQAPPDSEFSLRLSKLERQMTSVKEHELPKTRLSTAPPIICKVVELRNNGFGYNHIADILHNSGYAENSIKSAIADVSRSYFVDDL